MVMNRKLLVLLAALTVGALGAKAMAQVPHSGLDIDYAEHLPLVSRSLMLDVIRAGDTLIAAGERGHIILSDNEGETWRQAETVPTRATLTTLFNVGDRIWAAGHDTVILTSGDKGRTWTRQYLDEARGQPIMDLYFRDRYNGIATGAYGLLLLTSDGGKSWQDHYVNDQDDAHLNAIIALADGTLLIAGEAGYSYRSSDDADTWDSMLMPYGGSMFGAVSTRDSCIWFYGLRGHVLSSCDSGDSWQEVSTGSAVTLMDAVEDDGKMLLVGNSGEILTRNKAGEFSRQLHSSGVDFSAVLVLGNGRYLFAGEDGIYFYPEKNDGGIEP